MTEPKNEVHHVDQVEHHGHGEIKIDPTLMTDAIDGENEEHSAGVWMAFKQYPWACFWAFTMCFTIVSSPIFSIFKADFTSSRRSVYEDVRTTANITRSWNPSTCFSTVTSSLFPLSNRNTVSTSMVRDGLSRLSGRVLSFNLVNAVLSSVSSSLVL